MRSSIPALWIALFFVTVTVANGRCATRDEIVLSAAQKEVGRYHRLELAIDVGREYANPFDPCEVEVNILLTGPDGRSLLVPAFWGQDYERRELRQGDRTVVWCYPKGAGLWRARIAPMQTGTHTARAQLRDRHGEITSPPVTFECVASESRGFLRAGREDPRFFEFTEGQPFFAIGQNLAFIGESQYVTLSRAEEIFGKLAANGVNFLRIWTCCEDWAMAIEARKSAWTRSWTRESPIVPMPGGDGRCVRVEGHSGMSIAVSPCHNVALRPGTKYVLSGRMKMDGPEAVRIQASGNEWRISAGSGGWQTFEREFSTGASDYWLGRPTFRLMGDGIAWLDGLSLKEAAGGVELLWEADVNREIRGYYNPLDCFLLDQIVESAERNGIYLMLCVMTRDLYMESLSEVDSPAYRQAIVDAKEFMRYAVARWGYSTSVAAWEYFNEIDPHKPTDKFYAEVGRYLEQIGIYGHLRTTSTWHPSARDCRHPQIDIAQEHHYMRPDDDDFKDEVEAILRQRRFLREHAPNKPVLIGEFGLATQKWGRSEYMQQDPEGIHFRHCLWASALSGVSGTAMFWWWELLDQQGVYRHYKPLAEFLSDMHPAGLQPTTAKTSEPRLRIVGQQGRDRAYLWLANRQATWWNLVVEKREPDAIDSAAIAIAGLKPGRYNVLWWDTQEGAPVHRETAGVNEGRLELTVPPFTRDIACKITPAAFAE
ncbi:MAG: DUF5060 domain-containing protein [bacterium]|nr:DUF5060 domain-containing protein [bacterium]